MRRAYFLYFCILLALGGVLPQAYPAIISMKSGERLIGDITGESDEATLVVQSPLLGKLLLPRDQVDRIEMEQQAAITAQGEAKPPPAKEKPVASKGPSESEETRGMLHRLKHMKAPADWKGNLRVGLNLSQGDRKWTETYMRGNLVIDPKQTPNYYRFSGSYTFRETERGNGDTVVSTDRYDANFTYRRDITEKWFLQNSIGGRVDNVKGIDREVQELVGIGYRFEASKKLEFLVGGGGGVEDFRADFEDTRNGLSPVANLFQELTWRPFERASLVQEFNYFVNPEEAEQFNYLFTAAFRYRLTDLLGIEFSFNKNFDNDVGDGTEKDDTHWRNAVIVYF